MTAELTLTFDSFRVTLPFRAQALSLRLKPVISGQERSRLVEEVFSSVAVVDCDKRLGDSSVLRSWVFQQVEAQLRQGYVQISFDQWKDKLIELKYCADALVQFFVASGVISTAEQNFYSGGLHKVLLPFLGSWQRHTTNLQLQGLFAIFERAGFYPFQYSWRST